MYSNDVNGSRISNFVAMKQRRRAAVCYSGGKSEQQCAAGASAAVSALPIPFQIRVRSASRGKGEQALHQEAESRYRSCDASSSSRRRGKMNQAGQDSTDKRLDQALGAVRK